MRIIFILSCILISFFSFGQTKDAKYYFYKAARAYVKNTDSVCIYIKDGLQKYPQSQRLKSLAEKAQCLVGKPDLDNDGVPDSQDNCPDIYGEKTNQGCPRSGTPNPKPAQLDSDGDGLNDLQDNCPEQKGLKENNGCPKNQTIPQGKKDKDKDGIPDSEDNCPSQRGSRVNGGCPEEPPKKAPLIEVDVRLSRGSGNTIQWSPELMKAAEEIRITFVDAKNRTWVDNERISGNSYLYDPGDGRAGEIYTTVILDIELKSGYVFKAGTKKKLEKQIFDCSAD